MSRFTSTLRGWWNPNNVDLDCVVVVNVAWDMILSLVMLCTLINNLSIVHICGVHYQSYIGKMIVSSLLMELFLLVSLFIKRDHGGRLEEWDQPYALIL